MEYVKNFVGNICDACDPHWKWGNYVDWKDKTVIEEKELVRIFNDRYINVVERSCGTKPTNVLKEQEIEDNKKAVEVIYKSFANHESIKAIKENNIAKNLTAGKSYLPKVSACDIEQLLRNRNKSTRIDKHTDDKYSVTNFRPVSILNTFSKIYEKIVNDTVNYKL